jgi:hypothetical protein
MGGDSLCARKAAPAKNLLRKFRSTNVRKPPVLTGGLPLEPMACAAAGRRNRGSGWNYRDEPPDEPLLDPVLPPVPDEPDEPPVEPEEPDPVLPLPDMPLLPDEPEEPPAEPLLPDEPDEPDMPLLPLVPLLAPAP